MGRLIYSMSVSLDGFVETPSRSLDWAQVDEELHSVFNDEERALSAVILGLIDQVRLYVHPVILGAGTPFFPALDDRVPLELLETRTFASGVVHARYEVVHQNKT
jgi:hypothetical protein